ncbi:TPA: glycosyltransferase [Vibrio campbellii]|nr:glycosyltransferase [Vibrio campbellii]
MLLTIFPDFDFIHAKKDVGQICVRLAKYFNVKPHVLAYKEIPSSKVDCNPGLLNVIKIKELVRRRNHRSLDVNVILFLLFNSKKIKVLNLYHCTFASQMYINLYKRINKNGIAYLKLDQDLNDDKNSNDSAELGLKSWVKKIVYSEFINSVDIVSAETQEGYLLINDLNIYNEKLIKVPNGFSSDYYLENNIAPSFEDKENLILTVGRIGSQQKNIKLMLSVLSKVDLKNWKYVFAGPIEPSFEEEIDAFFFDNPEKKGVVEFIGMQNDTELNDLYRKAKLFVLSSNYEGFPLVFPEALFFGCYILTTNVSSSEDITKNGTVGTVVPIGCIDSMRKSLQHLIDTDISKDMFFDSVELCKKEFYWDEIVKDSFYKFKCINE